MHVHFSWVSRFSGPLFFLQCKHNIWIVLFIVLKKFLHFSCFIISLSFIHLHILRIKGEKQRRLLNSVEFSLPSTRLHQKSFIKNLNICKIQWMMKTSLCMGNSNFGRKVEHIRWRFQRALSCLSLKLC
jgi:hypothetical protein